MTCGNWFQEYYHVHNKEMDTPSLAAMLSTILYYRRFFPYYVYNIIAGLDSEGDTCVRVKAHLLLCCVGIDLACDDVQRKLARSSHVYT